MNLFHLDAAVVGAKEALQLAVVWLVLASLPPVTERRGLLRYFFVGLALTSLLFPVSFFLSPGIALKAFLSKLTGYVFFIFFMASAALLFRGSLAGSLSRGRAPEALVLVLTVFYFSPDVFGSCLYMRELSLMRGESLPVYLSFAGAFVFSLAVAFAAFRGRRLSVGRFFGIGQFFLFLALVKLLAGGIGGINELSLLPSVQRGVMKFVHDVVHQNLVMFMVPDHPLLQLTVWNFIGIFFGPNFAMLVALLLVLLPPAAFLYLSLASPLQGPEGPASGSERRKHRASIRRDRRRKAVPAVVFMLVIIALWFGGRGEQASSLYVPRPKPVVVDKGQVIIPLTDPTMDLMDGRLHTFSLLSGEGAVGLLVIKKPDGRLAVCLNACEICPPEGYGLSEENVVCIYCKTPIPVGSLGRSGGCNPIPLEAAVSEKDVRIDLREIEAQWKNVVTGKTKEGIR